jgi:hypothetical protein
MKNKLSSLFSIVMLVFIQLSFLGQTEKSILSLEEQKLYDLIMEYRKSKGLKSIPLSNSLTFVAQTHSRDLSENKPDLKSKCNAHSWSDQGEWSSCCYTSDHKQASCMWDKPKELTSYKGTGYEISVGSSDPRFSDFICTPEYALKSWQGSFHHNNVIVNKGIWAEDEWKAMGIGLYKGFAVIWFGKLSDQEGEPDKE